MFFWKREKRDTKRIQAVSPWRILFGKGRRERKMNSTLLFSRFGKPGNFRKFLAKERRKKRQRMKIDIISKLFRAKNKMEKCVFFHQGSPLKVVIFKE